MITVTALAVLLVTITIVFAARSLLQYRRTGDSGWRAPARKTDPSQAWARLMMAAAFLLLLVAPIADLAGLLPRIAGLEATPVRVVGVVVAVISAIVVVAAQLDMGASWRVGVDPGESTSLVTGGVFRLVRNPIFTAIIGFTLGLTLAVPNLVTVAGCAVAVVGVQWQVRRVEEPYLLRTHGDAYRSYAAGTGRFLPGVGRFRRSPVRREG